MITTVLYYSKSVICTLYNPSHPVCRQKFLIKTSLPHQNKLSGRQTQTSSRTPDWEAEGIIVLPDDAVTLSHCPSNHESQRQSLGSSHSNISKKSILPPIGKGLDNIVGDDELI